MNCKFCNGGLEADSLVCPHCQKDNAQEAPVTEEEVPESTVETVENLQQEEAAGEPDEAVELLPEEEAEEEAPAAPKRKTWIKVTAIVCCVVIVLGLAAGIWYSINGGFLPKENDIYFRDSYTKADDAMLRAADVVVARVGDKQLTNGQLQIQYWMQISQFLNTYSYYVGAFGLDTTVPLSEQMMMDSDITWEQYFLEAALTAWHQNQSLMLAAEEEGYQVSEDALAYLEGLPASLEEAAVSYGFADAQAFLAAVMDDTCTVEEYLACMDLDCKAADYLPTKIETPTREEVEAHFDAYAESFASNYGVTKDSGKLIDVRHILIFPEGGTTNELGGTDYTEDAWEACRVKAQEILDEWKAGEATEASFADLAYAYSEDSSYADGGLYTYVYEDQMVEEFDDWCFDESREYGDTGLVRTVFGYHIMYFVYGEEGWFRYGQQSLAQELSTQFITELTQKYPMKVNYRKIILGDAVLSG